MGTAETVEHRFIQRMRKERELRGWSQAVLARKLTEEGVRAHPSTVAKIERGERAIRLDEVSAAARVFRLTVDAMIGQPQDGGLSDAVEKLPYVSANAAEALRGIADDLLGLWQAVTPREAPPFNRIQGGVGNRAFTRTAFIREALNAEGEGADRDTYLRAVLAWSEMPFVSGLVKRAEQEARWLSSVSAMPLEEVRMHLAGEETRSLSPSRQPLQVRTFTGREPGNG